MASVLAAIGIFGGIVPEFSWQSSRLTFNSSAYTQDFTDTQINNYAAAVLKIEEERQQAYREIQKIIGKSPPAIVCNQPNTFRSLPPEARKIAVNYCNTSKRIAQKSGLTVDEFNAITARLQSDQNLKRRIQSAMIRIRRRR
jgi:ABC-type transport system substrate-binding protein